MGVRVQLTFDDGPGPSTPRLLEVLGAANVRATMFLLGANIEQLRAVAIAVARAGHALGNHTYSHARPGALTPDALIAEVERTDTLLADVAAEAGVPLASHPPVRLPYGAVEGDPRVPVLERIGRPHAGWTADFEDWKATDAPTLAREMERHVRARLAIGEYVVIDLHDSSRRLETRDVTVDAVERLIAELGADVFVRA